MAINKNSSVSLMSYLFDSYVILHYVLYSVIDSSSASPTSYLKGTSSNLGDYDQCLNAKLLKSRIIENNGFESHVLGQFCQFHVFPQTSLETEVSHIPNINEVLLADVAMKHYTTILGLCLPSSCSSNELYHMLTERE